MTDLTEQWKKGELPNGIYYVELLGGNTMIAYMYKVHPYKNKTVYRVKAFNGFITKYQMKSVLYKVPTYEEYLTMKDCVKAEFEAVVKMTQAQMDCKTLAQTLLKVSPEHKAWLEKNYKEYL